MLKEIDSVIFDLDGTLWDSCQTVAEAWQSAIDQLDFPAEPLTTNHIRSLAGLPYDVIYHKLFPSLNEEQRNNLKNSCAKEELLQVNKKGGVLYEGLEETLSYLKKKYRLFIVSNCQSGYIEGFMKYHKLQEYFDDCECFGNFEKPKFENILEIIRRNQLKSAVYVGDTQGDLEAAKKSGVPFIYARYGFGQLPPQPYAIDRLSDLKKLL